MLLDEVWGANLVGAETLGLGAAGVLVAAVLVISLGSGLEATFGSGLGLAPLLSVLAAAGLLAALVLLTALTSALDLAGVLSVALPLGSGLAGAFADLLADFRGVLGIGLEGVLVGALAADLGVGLDGVAFALLAGVLVGSLLALLGLAWGFEVLLLVALGEGFRADLPEVEAASCGRLALRMGVLEGILALAGVLSCDIAADLLGDVALALPVAAPLLAGLALALLLPETLLLAALTEDGDLRVLGGFFDLELESAAFTTFPEVDGFEGARTLVCPERDGPFVLAAVLRLLKQFTSQ